MNGYCRIRISSNKTAMTGPISPFSSPPHSLKKPITLPKDIKLSRNFSSASKRFRDREKGHAMVRRAFSMRKTSSATEGYWRIHDNEEHWDEEEKEITYFSGKKKKKGRILRACKRLFGF